MCAVVPARDEEKLQRRLVARLEGLGAQTDLWEPEATGSGTRSIPAGLDFAGRPQLAAVLAGSGGGRSLLLNGHIDAVDATDRRDWRSDPYKLDERNGILYGAFSNFMKHNAMNRLIA